MKKQIIAVDIDDVMAAGAAGFIKYSNETWGHTLTVEDFDENFAVAWGVSIEEAMRRVTQYLESGAHGRFDPLVEALPVLKRLAAKYELIIVTSRRLIIKPETDAWIAKHFPNIFSKIVYAGIYDNSNKDDVHHRLKHTKADVLKDLGADYLIDDQPKHCLGAAEAGVTCLLFGDYKWNRDITDLPKNVVRTKTWKQVEEYFNV
jgi:5'(3')-deoxyribonucleotidase